MQQKIMLRTAGTLALSAVLVSSAFAQKTTISDAQVQANLIKALAADTRLANDPITTSTAFGNVTLTGAVVTNDERDAADKIASRVDGVKKVVDQLRVGDAAVADTRSQVSNQTATSNQNPPQATEVVADGSQAPAGAPVQGDIPVHGNAPLQGSTQAGNEADLEQQQYGPRPADPGNDVSRQQMPAYDNGQQAGGSQASAPNDVPQYGAQGGQGYPQGGQGDPQSNQGYPQGNAQGYPQSNPGYPQANQGYPQSYPGASPQVPPQGRLYRRDYERQMAERNGYPRGNYANGYGQPGGQHVVVSNGTVLGVRINRWISSGDAESGSTFTAIVANDVVSGGQIAIPRGATVQGTVLDAKGSGALKGRGSLTLRLNSLTLGGQVLPLVSEPFTVNGRDKAAQSVNSTIAGGAIGAIIGGIAGGGAGAAIGAGVGGAAGLGASAASGGGQAVLPSEALLQFRLTSSVELTTVSEAELQRLGQYAGPAVSRGPRPSPYDYPGAYPGYYGRPY